MSRILVDFECWHWPAVSHIICNWSVVCTATRTKVLDDQLVKTQSMRGSRYITAFLGRCTRWEKILKDLQAIMDAWIKMQASM